MNSREIAIHFLNLSNIEKSRNNIVRAVKSANALLENYTSKQIIDVVDYLINIKKISLYSLAYLNNHMDVYLKEISDLELKEKYTEYIRNMKPEPTQEVSIDEESIQRNNNKLHRFGVQSRVREKFDFDLFAESGQDT